MVIKFNKGTLNNGSAHKIQINNAIKIPMA